MSHPEAPIQRVAPFQNFIDLTSDSPQDIRFTTPVSSENVDPLALSNSFGLTNQYINSDLNPSESFSLRHPSYSSDILYENHYETWTASEPTDISKPQNSISSLQPFDPQLNTKPSFYSINYSNSDIQLPTQKITITIPRGPQTAPKNVDSGVENTDVMNSASSTSSSGSSSALSNPEAVVESFMKGEGKLTDISQLKDFFKASQACKSDQDISKALGVLNKTNNNDILSLITEGKYLSYLGTLCVSYGTKTEGQALLLLKVLTSLPFTAEGIAKLTMDKHPIPKFIRRKSKGFLN